MGTPGPRGAKGVPRCGPDVGTTPRTPCLIRVSPEAVGSCEGQHHNVTSRMPLTGTSGSVKQNAHLVTPGQIPPTQPIIELPALLRLVEWHQDRRRRTQQGGLSCSNLEPPSSPPAPREGKQSSQFSAALGDLPYRASRTNSQRTDPCRRPATGEASRRQGGDA